MQIYWLTFPAIVLIYLGFAGLQGSLIHWLRAELSKDSLISGIGYSLLIFLPVSLSLPLHLWVRIVVWVFALGLILLYAVRPTNLPSWLWSMPFALRYSALMMLLILVWSLIFQPSVFGFILAAVAALAGGLAWRRSTN